MRNYFILRWVPKSIKIKIESANPNTPAIFKTIKTTSLLISPSALSFSLS